VQSKIQREERNRNTERGKIRAAQEREIEEEEREREEQKRDIFLYARVNHEFFFEWSTVFVYISVL
jgi:hypothetical protein